MKDKKPIGIIKAFLIAFIIIGILISFDLLFVSPNHKQELCDPNTNMDCAIETLQLHCINDVLSGLRNDGRYNEAFCDQFMNQSGILSLYNWGRK